MPCRSKKQKHDCVHVEVFLGGETGEATIGARFFKGKVNIFPSYKFTSTSWDCVKVHFRSLDTWLSGVCKSYCPEHPWITETSWLAGNKKSIFDENAESEEDVCAGEDVSQEEGAEAANAQEEAVREEEEPMCVPCGAAEVPEMEPLEGSSSVPTAPQPGGLEPTVQPVKRVPRPRPTTNASTEISASSEKTGTTASTAQDKRSAVATGVHTYYVGKSNGWKLVKQALDSRGWQQLPFEYKFSSRFGLKWVERRSDIDYRAHVPGQLVCHIPNNDCITTKTGLLNALRVYTTASALAPVKDKQASVSPARVSRASASPSKSVKAGQRQRSLSFGEEGKPSAAVSTKLSSITSYTKIPWLPETYLLESPADCEALLKAEETSPCLWIYKPSCFNRGRGIRVVKGLDALRALCYGVESEDPDTAVAPSKGIVQRYIENPLLIPGPSTSASPPRAAERYGHKFDVRVYLLIARTSPSYLAFYHPGYCRLTLQPYSTDDQLLDDSTIHLTNAAVQKQGPLYQEMKEFQVRLVAFRLRAMRLIGFV